MFLCSESSFHFVDVSCSLTLISHLWNFHIQHILHHHASSFALFFVGSHRSTASFIAWLYQISKSILTCLLWILSLLLCPKDFLFFLITGIGTEEETLLIFVSSAPQLFQQSFFVSSSLPVCVSFALNRHGKSL